MNDIESVYAAVQSYDEWLDELHDETTFNIPASRILRECDPIGYRCGFVDWLDAEGLGDAAEEWEDSHNWPE